MTGPLRCEAVIHFNDLRPLHRLLANEVNAAVQRVLTSGRYILGPELEAFEAAFAAYLGTAHAVGVATGTDAVELALRVAGIGPGDEVITVSHTAVATVCAIERAGATPVLVDIDATTYTMDPATVEAAISSRTAALVPVHLYGQPADLHALGDIAARHRLLVVEDCAQAHGARYAGRRVGTFGHLAAFSFYPTKNLGAYGDGGAVVTSDSQFAERLRRVRTYGQSGRESIRERGMNSRLDELQAAILATKLPYLDEHNAVRRRLAQLYWEGLSALHGVTAPTERSGATHVYHLYVMRCQGRDRLRVHLEQRGVGTLIHYPVPVHLHPAYEHLRRRVGKLPVTESLMPEIVSLPLYIGLSATDVASVVRAVGDYAAGIDTR